MTTPLILAIEPDRQQAAQLASIAGRLSVELVLMDTTAQALGVLRERLPDLVVTPALLSRRDDLALTERLRGLAEAGAHIQTLTIPILEAPEPPSRGGMFSALRRKKPRATGPAGCDADTFANQIAVYLERAAEVRRERAEPQAPAPATVSIPVPLADARQDAADSVEIYNSPVVEELPIVPPSGETAVFVEQERPVATEPARSVEESAPEVFIEMAPVVHDTGGEILVPILPIATTHATEPNTAERDQDGPVDDSSCFDPEQCRYAALLAKLDEITAEP